MVLPYQILLRALFTQIMAWKWGFFVTTYGRDGELTRKTPEAKRFGGFMLS